ncbi:MAG: ABC transporter permease [Deltaproteobacteria bacterium]|nr:MAG: ABC transporter permease [Deltaproteobacteria bacterium]
MDWLLRSLRQSPWLTAAMIVKLGFAAGLAAATFAAAWSTAGTRDAAAEQHVYRVVSAANGTERTAALSLDVIRTGAELLNGPELDAAIAAAPPLRASATFTSWLPVTRPDRPPERALVRFCAQPLFALFGYTWVAGGPWPESADVDPDAAVAVLGEDLARRLFADVPVAELPGRPLVVRGVGPFTIVGVTRGPPRAYAAPLGVEDKRVDLFLPFSTAARLAPTPRDRRRVQDEGVTCGRVCAMPHERWAAFWVEAATAEEVAGLLDRTRGGVPEGTLRAEPLSEALAASARWPIGVRFVTVTAGLLLLLASLSVSGMLQGKFELRVPELRLHRALGASATHVLRQHALELGAMWLLATALAFAVAFGFQLLGREVLGARYASLALGGAVPVVTPLATLVAFGLAAVRPLLRVTLLSPGGADPEGR